MDLTKKIVLFDIDYTLFDTEHFKKSNLSSFKLYEEIGEMLLHISQFAEIGIFSEGKNDLQMEKLRNTNLLSFFSHSERIHIFESKSNNLDFLLEHYKAYSIVFVDDKLEVLYQVRQKRKDIFTIWVKRGKYAAAQKPIHNFAPDAIIKTLHNAYQIIIAFYT